MGYQINKIYVCQKMGIPILNCKAFTNYPYKKGSIELNSGDKSIYRYARDFTVDGISFCMLLLTERKADKSINSFFEDNLKEISSDSKMKKLLLGIGFRPIELKIKYGDK